MTEPEKKCPFKAGDLVVYKPSQRGWGLEANSSEKLVRGKIYRVEGIQKDYYVLVEGYRHPGGGPFGRSLHVTNDRYSAGSYNVRTSDQCHNRAFSQVSSIAKKRKVQAT